MCVCEIAAIERTFYFHSELITSKPLLRAKQVSLNLAFFQNNRRSFCLWAKRRSLFARTCQWVDTWVCSAGC